MYLIDFGHFNPNFHRKKSIDYYLVAARRQGIAWVLGLVSFVRSAQNIAIDTSIIDDANHSEIECELRGEKIVPGPFENNLFSTQTKLNTTYRFFTNLQVWLWATEGTSSSS